MVKIYKDEKSLQIVIEGVSPEFSSLLEYQVNNGRVLIRSRSKKQIVFDDRWENISDVNGTVFTEQADLVAYLEEVFSEVQLKNEPDVDGLVNNIDYLAYYINAKN